MYHPKCRSQAHKEKGGRSPLFVTFGTRFLGRARGTPHSKRIRPAEAVTLAGLVAHVAGVEITIHGILEGCADEVLQAVGHVGGQEPAVGVGQEVVDGVALRDGAVVVQCVGVVVGGTDQRGRFRQEG